MTAFRHYLYEWRLGHQHLAIAEFKSGSMLQELSAKWAAWRVHVEVCPNNVEWMSCVHSSTHIITPGQSLLCLLLSCGGENLCHDESPLLSNSVILGWCGCACSDLGGMMATFLGQRPNQSSARSLNSVQGSKNQSNLRASLNPKSKSWRLLCSGAASKPYTHP